MIATRFDGRTVGIFDRLQGFGIPPGQSENLAGIHAVSQIADGVIVFAAGDKVHDVTAYLEGVFRLGRGVLSDKAYPAARSELDFLGLFNVVID